MKKKLVYICSPCRGDYENIIQNARIYCAWAMLNFPDVVPIAPHIYFTQFLNDKLPDERTLGMDAGMALLDMCDELWVYGVDSPSAGMRAEIERARQRGITVRDGFKLQQGGGLI